MIVDDWDTASADVCSSTWLVCDDGAALTSVAAMLAWLILPLLLLEDGLTSFPPSGLFKYKIINNSKQFK